MKWGLLLLLFGCGEVSGDEVDAMPGSDDFEVSISTHDFGARDIHDTGSDAPHQVEVTITNKNETQQMFSVALTEAQSFSLDNSDCAASVAPGATCKVAITFKPIDVGALASMLKINNQDAVTIAGTGSAILRIGIIGNVGGTVSGPGGITCNHMTDPCEFTVSTATVSLTAITSQTHEWGEACPETPTEGCSYTCVTSIQNECTVDFNARIDNDDLNPGNDPFFRDLPKGSRYHVGVSFEN